jgi:hypothetical protein
MRIFIKRCRGMFVLLTVLLGTLPPAYGGKARHGTICQLCGMDAAKSETEFILHRTAERELHACCVNCAHRLMKKLGAEITNVTTLDYRTRRQVPASGAFYVRDSKLVPKGSMVPFVFAFEARKDAEALQARYGGAIFGFEEIVSQLEAEKKSE